MSDAVIVEKEAGVVELRLNRPEKRNAVDGEIMNGLLSAIEQIKGDKTVRVVVLSGEGKGFCAGLDMASFGDMVSGDLTADSAASAYDELSASGANRVQQLGWGLQELEIPVIAAVHGGAMGGGLNLALGADIRVMAPDAKLGFVEITFGLLPDMSATQSLRHIARLDRIKELIFTGFRNDVADFYQIADLYVMSSVQEGLGTAVLDALALAKPVVATNAGGLPEIIHDGKTGRLVEPANPEALADGIVDLLTRVEAAKAMAKEGRAMVQNRFSIEAMVDNNIEVYQKVLANG